MKGGKSWLLKLKNQNHNLEGIVKILNPYQKQWRVFVNILKNVILSHKIIQDLIIEYIVIVME